ncbi:12877_t:CDS:2 [Funneliformis geosporum]|uniref:12877_t:CDS:1 n=1 Tax=Funneliformis geosporum TaxID=1117311 RepID=A0A9W4T2B6_9GLOM|nr:12877_t:CDS:2 [Funneliformis geosporum]
MPPREKRNEYKQYDPKNLPMQNHSQFKKQIRQLDKTNSSKDQYDLESEFGIKGCSILFNLQATCFPTSFPIDMMHLIYKNIAGNEMYSIRKSLPTYLERPPRNIVIHHNGYNAEEWVAWITMYSLPLLKGRMPNRHYKWPQKQHAEHLAYSNGDEDFYFPFKKHTLSQSKLKKIKKHFSASYDIRGRTPKKQDMDGYGQKIGIILDLNELEEIKTKPELIIQLW